MKKEPQGEITITKVQEASIEVYLLGRTPLILNRLSEKAKHELLLPRGKKTAGDKANSLKHDPFAEFQASAYTIADESAPTYLGIPSTAPKKAMAAAALDIPGAKKAQIGRLTYVHGERIAVYGKPFLKMDPVRSADMNRTPDIRTRCAIKEWVAILEVSFVTPALNATAIVNLLHGAGLYIGVGDWRNEKGAGNYGQFEVLSQANERVREIMKHGREAQKAAMEDPELYDDETAELLSWFNEELELRGKKKVAVAA